ncbi:MAG: UDP-2,3-diacylglucosamine diphosphatase LpxI [Ahrensia sp.]
MTGNLAAASHPTRYGVVAGSGQIPVDLCARLAAEGHVPIVFMLEGEANEALRHYRHFPASTARIGDIVKTAHKQGVTHMVMVGGVHRRPLLREFRPDLFTLKLLPRVLAALRMGDDGILAQIVTGLEERGLRVVGVHELMPDMVAEAGPMGRVKPSKAEADSVQLGAQAALTLGTLDAGQGVVVTGKRVVALEGAEGTDAMVLRIADLKASGRLTDKRAGVLVKVAKPGQELRVDMPTIGVQTVRNAAKAKLAGIAVQAGQTLIVDRQAVEKAADEAGLFIFGLDAP